MIARALRTARLLGLGWVLHFKMLSQSAFDGVLGKWSFDKNGDTTLRTMSGNTVKDGKFAFVTVLGEDE